MKDRLELNLELELQAWLDGELSAPKARRIDPKIVGDEEASRLITELQAIKSALAGNEMARPVPETRAFYWSKIERQIQRQTDNPRPVQAPRQAVWRRWLAPLAGFAALACLLLLAVKPYAPSAFDEISSTGEGMEAVTFHDQSAGMTVVWLTDTAPARLIESPDVQTPAAGNSEVEVE
jgi:anti-sigma-K factor RskA